jgi:hypothetical protein
VYHEILDILMYMYLATTGLLLRCFHAVTIHECDKDKHRFPALGRLTVLASSGRGYASEMLQGETWRPMTCRDRQRIHAMLHKGMARPRKTIVVVHGDRGGSGDTASSEYRNSVLVTTCTCRLDALQQTKPTPSGPGLKVVAVVKPLSDEMLLLSLLVACVRIWQYY